MKSILKYVKEFSGLMALLLCLVLFFVYRTSPQKIAFVRSEELIYDYAGMKEVQTAFEAKQLGRQSSLDTLTADYQKEYAFAMSSEGGLSESEKAVLSERKAQIVNLTNVLQASSKKDEEEMLSSVFNQINDFAKLYATEHGYDLILGTTSDGNILYGVPAIDITEDLLKALNADYHGK